jgi:hypothetical protein
VKVPHDAWFFIAQSMQVRADPRTFEQVGPKQTSWPVDIHQLMLPSIHSSSGKGSFVDLIPHCFFFRSALSVWRLTVVHSYSKKCWKVVTTKSNTMVFKDGHSHVNDKNKST